MKIIYFAVVAAFAVVFLAACSVPPDRVISDSDGPAFAASSDQSQASNTKVKVPKADKPKADKPKADKPKVKKPKKSKAKKVKSDSSNANGKGGNKHNRRDKGKAQTKSHKD